MSSLASPRIPRAPLFSLHMNAKRQTIPSMAKKRFAYIIAQVVDLLAFYNENIDNSWERMDESWKILKD